MGDFWIQVQSVSETPSPFLLETTPVWWEAARVVPPEVGLRLLEPFVTALEGYRLGRRLLFRGELRGAVELACAGCSEPFVYRHRSPVELLLEPLPTGVESPKGGIELDPEEESVGRYAGEALDFEPVVLESLLLAWPMHPRCSENCLGLCPSCGCNRNRERCSCAEPSAAHPLGELAGRPARRPRERGSSR
jgi:uncharacterized protein